MLTLCAALLLSAFALLDTSFAGQSWDDAGRFAYATADGVRFGLGGLRYLYGGEPLTGPHLAYPLTVLALTGAAGLRWEQRGGTPPGIKPQKNRSGTLPERLFRLVWLTWSW